MPTESRAVTLARHQSLVLLVACSHGALRRLADVGRHAVRNMVSPLKGLPTTWDVKTGKNIKWVAELGSQ